MIRAATAVLGICFLVWLGTGLDWRRNPDVDFAALYSASKLGPSRYLDVPAMRAENARLGNILPARSYWPRLPVFVALSTPLSALPFPVALSLWRIISALVLIASIAIWSRWNHSIFPALAWSVPATFMLYFGQDVGFAFLAVSASLVTANPFVAGALLGLAILKWHLFLFVPVVLIARREWRIVAGACISVAALVAVSFAIFPDWVPRMIAMIAESDQPYFDRSPGLRVLFVAFPLAFAVIFLSAVPVIWRAASRTPLHVGLALALAAGTIVNIHSYAVDCILLLPLAGELLARKDPLERIVGVFVASPVPYILLVWFGIGAPLRLAVLAGAVLVLTRRQIAGTSTFEAAAACRQGDRS